jgi:hypothetical protein
MAVAGITEPGKELLYLIPARPQLDRSPMTSESFRWGSFQMRATGRLLLLNYYDSFLIALSSPPTLQYLKI